MDEIAKQLRGELATKGLLAPNYHQRYKLFKQITNKHVRQAYQSGQVSSENFNV